VLFLADWITGKGEALAGGRRIDGPEAYRMAAVIINMCEYRSPLSRA